METLLGYKISVLVAVLCAAMIRVMRIRSKSKTRTGRVIETTIVFAVSILFALLLLHPLMLMFAVPAAYEVFVAMLLALSSELLVTKLLHVIENLSIADIVSKFKSGKLIEALKVFLRDDNKDGDK